MHFILDVLLQDEDTYNNTQVILGCSALLPYFRIDWHTTDIFDNRRSELLISLRARPKSKKPVHLLFDERLFTNIRKAVQSLDTTPHRHSKRQKENVYLLGSQLPCCRSSQLFGKNTLCCQKVTEMWIPCFGFALIRTWSPQLESNKPASRAARTLSSSSVGGAWSIYSTDFERLCPAL